MRVGTCASFCSRRHLILLSVFYELYLFKFDDIQTSALGWPARITERTGAGLAPCLVPHGLMGNGMAQIPPVQCLIRLRAFLLEMRGFTVCLLIQSCVVINWLIDWLTDQQLKVRSSQTSSSLITVRSRKLAPHIMHGSCWSFFVYYCISHFKRKYISCLSYVMFICRGKKTIFFGLGSPTRFHSVPVDL